MYTTRYNPRATRTMRRLSSLLVVVLVFSQLISVTPVYAASYTATWNSKTDFENNTAGNGGNISTTTARTPNIDTTTTPGTVTLKANSLKGALTENFSGTNGTDYHLDVANSWATTTSVTTYTQTGNNLSSSELVAHWSFDNTVMSGTSVSDVSGNNYTGTLSGSPTTGVAGPTGFGQAITLNGSSQYMQMPNGLLNINSPKTVSLWFKTISSGVLVSDQSATYPSSPSNFEPSLLVGTDGKLRGLFYNGGTGSITSSAVVNDGNWHLATLTYNGSTQTLYLDGTLVGTANGSISYQSASIYDYVGLGYTNSWPGGFSGWSFFNGSVDDAAIYNRALSPSEVSRLYTYNPGTYSSNTVNKLVRTNSDRFQDLTSLFPSLASLSNSQQQAVAYDSNHNYLFLANTGKLWQLNLTTGVLTSLTGKMPWSDDPRYAKPFLSFDPLTSTIVDSFTNGSTFLYNTNTGVVTRIMTTHGGTNAIPLINGNYSPLATSAINPTNDLLYLAQATTTSSNSVTETFYSYNLQTGAVSTVGSPYLVTVGGGGCDISGPLVYSAYDGKAYQLTTGGGTIKVGTDGTITSVPVSVGCWAPSTPVVDPISGMLFGSSGSWNVGLLANNTGTTVVPQSIAFTQLFGVTPVNNYTNNYSTYDPVSRSIYVGFENGLVARYGPSGANAKWSNVLSAPSGLGGLFNSTTGDYSNNGVIAASNGNMYWVGADTQARFASSTPAPFTQPAYSTTLATVSAGIQSATIKNVIADNGTTGSITYYLSNDNGVTWEAATPNTPHTFTNPLGTQLKYRIDLTGDATVSSFDLSYNDTNYTGIIQSIEKDTMADSQWVSLKWNATLPSNTQVQFRTRGATDAQGLSALQSAQWSDYYTATTSGASGIAIQANGTGGSTLPAYRYLEVQASLISQDGVNAPALTSLSLQYALNAPPDFNPALGSGAGATASQVTSTDVFTSGTETPLNWGKVRIDYGVRGHRHHLRHRHPQPHHPHLRVPSQLL